MQGTFNHDRPHYRCRFPREYALANHTQHPAAVYVREDRIVPSLDRWLATAFTADNVEQTLDRLADNQIIDHQEPADAQAIAACDRKLAGYRAALDAGADPAVVGEWIAQVQAERSLAQARAHGHAETGRQRLTRAEITHLVDTLHDVARVIHDADPRDKAEIYRELGLRLTYRPATETVLAEAQPAPVYVRYVSKGRVVPYVHRQLWTTTIDASVHRYA
jgi:site-specific DNA recombinase